jgi:hypothetical protein
VSFAPEYFISALISKAAHPGYLAELTTEVRALIPVPKAKKSAKKVEEKPED